MSKIGLYILAAFAISSVVYFGVEAIKSAGREELAARVEAEKADLVKSASQHAAETTKAMQERAVAAERALAQSSSELEDLRNERIRTGGDFVVFGDDYSEWMRGKRSGRSGH